MSSDTRHRPATQKPETHRELIGTNSRAEQDCWVQAQLLNSWPLYTAINQLETTERAETMHYLEIKPETRAENLYSGKKCRTVKDTQEDMKNGERDSKTFQGKHEQMERSAIFMES